LKKFYQSKTILFNALFLVLSVAAYFGFADFMPNDKMQDLAAVIVAVINIYLRFRSNLPIK
jgi:hypothetical protein